MIKHLRFIINPISGVGKKNKLPGLIARTLDKDMFEYSIVYTEKRGHGAQLAKEAIADGVDIVCAVGGDGSVHEIGAALIGSNTILAILPCGSGNGFARHLKLDMQLKPAIMSINAMDVREVDTARANDKSFLGVAGFGFDALIAKKFDEYHRRGLLSYIKLVIQSYFKYKPAIIEIDGVVYKDLLLCTVANGSQFGNGFCIAPNASIEDGELELFTLKQFPWYKTLGIAFKFFNKTIDKSKYARFIPVKNVNLKINDSHMHLDGEPIEVDANVSLEVMPKSLRVIVGKKYDYVR